MNLYAKLTERAAQGKPLRVGLIGAGKFGAMYLAQVPKTPGRASRRHRRSVAGQRARQPRARRLAARAARRDFARRRARAAAHPRRRRLGGPGRASRYRDHRRGDRQPDRGGDACARGVRHGKHVVMVTVEADALCGPLLARRAAGGGRRLQPCVRRPAGAHLRSRRLGARGRVQRRRCRTRSQVAAALRAVDAGDGVGVLRAHAGAGARRRAESEDVQLVPRWFEAGDREHRGVQCDRARPRPRRV